MSSIQYRPEIDGLRAIAVSAVILFHAAPEALPGGFLGVDIFFVISGYLIASIILRQQEHQSFRFLEFYERRAKRLFPQLFLVCAACIPFAWLWMMPAQLKDFGQSLVAVSIYLSNFLFWRESDYFALAAEEKPLLHTWSLGVEEQFYLIFPLLIIVLTRNKLRSTVALGIMAAVTSAGFCLSIVLQSHAPSANFYLIPGRAWEFLAGAFLGFLPHTDSKNGNNQLAITSVFVLAIPLFFYLPETTPIFMQFLAVVGTAGLIYFGHPTNTVGKIFTQRSVVYLGKISYGAYLWHQPIFAFTRIRLEGEIGISLSCILILLTFIAAHYSFVLVEQPIRQDKSGYWTRSRLLVTTLSITVIFVLLGTWIHFADGFKNRFNIVPTVYESMAVSPLQDRCFGPRKLEDPEQWFCKLGNSDATPEAFIFGDSHLINFLPALEYAANRTGTSILAAGLGSCAPLLDIYIPEEFGISTNCHDTNQRVLDFLKNSDIKQIILIARWELYTDGGYTGTKFRYLSMSENGPMNKKESRRAFGHGLSATVATYQKLGIRTQFFMQIPRQQSEILDLFGKFSSGGRHSINELSVTLNQHEELQSYNKSIFKELGIPIQDFTWALCHNGVCPFGTPTTSFYFDDNHLSLIGSQRLFEPIEHWFVSEGPGLRN